MTTLLSRTPAVPAVPVDSAGAPAQGQPGDVAQLGEPVSAFAGTPAERLVLAVAPTTGRFRPVAGGDDLIAVDVEGGTLLGHITGGRGRADAVTAPTAGTVRRLLARPGQLVFAGQALVWVEQVDMEHSDSARGHVRSALAGATR